MRTSADAPPAFVWLSPVFFDKLDLNGALHNSRFALHVERAQSALFETFAELAAGRIPAAGDDGHA